MKTTKRRPYRIMVKPKSEQQVLRLAALLAYSKLSWTDQQDLRSRAEALLSLMHQTRSP